MTTAAPHNEQSLTTAATLFVAFELSEKTWKLGFTTGHGQKPRERTITARQQERVAYLRAADNVSGPLASCLSSVNQPVIRTQDAFSALLPSLLADI